MMTIIFLTNRYFVKKNFNGFEPSSIVESHGNNYILTMWNFCIGNLFSAFWLMQEWIRCMTKYSNKYLWCFVVSSDVIRERFLSRVRLPTNVATKWPLIYNQSETAIQKYTGRVKIDCATCIQFCLTLCMARC